MIDIRRGEFRTLASLAVVGITYWAAVTIGDTAAQSIFIDRVGAAYLPRVFLFKAVVDMVAAALYVPLSNKRSPRAVWRSTIAIYVVTSVAASVLLPRGTSVVAYVVYVGHECAWTLLTIHWAVFILDVLDASQARRLFPLLFTAARVGGILGGLALRTLSGQLGVHNMFLVGAGFATVAGLWTLRHRPSAADLDEVPGRRTGGWRAVLSSPLLHAIAASTAAMVLARYGLRVVSLDEIGSSMANNEAMIAEFLGTFIMWADLAGAVIGVLIVPRLLTLFGVGATNLVYSTAVLGSYAALIANPTLAIAAAARFVNMQLKDALKTPLSALFYGAEPPERRARARAFMFGVIIPAATIATGLVFEFTTRLDDGMQMVAFIGLGAGGVFWLACWVQNRRWRTQLGTLLELELAGSTGQSPPEELERWLAAELAPFRSDANSERLDAIERGLLSPDRDVEALAEELLAETIPRSRGHEIARATRQKLRPAAS